MEITIDIPDYVKAVIIAKKENDTIRVAAMGNNYNENFVSFSQSLLTDNKQLVNEVIQEMFETLNPNEKAK